MNKLFLYCIALLPIVLFCYLIYRVDKYEKEPLRPLLIAFALGALITIPTIYIEEAIVNAGWFDMASIGQVFLYAFVGVALVEELLKGLVFFIYPFRSKYLDEPFDGVVYMVMVAMGFAAVENINYVLEFGIETGLLRGLTAVPAHVTFGIISGYYFGRAKFEHHHRIALIVLGFLAAIFFHTLYDFLILQDFSQYLMLGSALGVYLLAVLGFFMVRNALHFSPHKEDKT